VQRDVYLFHCNSAESDDAPFLDLPVALLLRNFPSNNDSRGRMNGRLFSAGNSADN
jgi:hypothetical protein